MHRFHYRARSDGGSGHVVEFSAVLFDFPVALFMALQRGVVEAGDPVALGDLDVIAQPRCLPVRYYAHAAYPAIVVDGDNQIDFAAVTIRCAGLQHCDGRFVLQAAAIGDSFVVVAQQRIGSQYHGVLDDVVIERSGGRNLPDQFKLLDLFTARDSFVSQFVSQSQQCRADQRKEQQVERGVNGGLGHAASHGWPPLDFLRLSFLSWPFLPNTLGWV